jgi:WD40 repeat protein
MTVAPACHPDPERLRAFVQGRLSETDAAEVETHLSGCPTCAEQLGRLDDVHDALLVKLKSAVNWGTTVEFCQDTPTLAALRPSTETPGTIIGRYRLLQPLGEGGMGTVFLAEQTEPVRRQVALKLIKAGLASAQTLVRFAAERQALAEMDHPHIVPIYEVGEHDGQPFYAMKWIEGTNLERCLANFTHEPQATARLLTAVARAVHHAHQRGLLHRDLKPSNILLDRDGQPYVTDFGLAKRLEQGGGMTQSGAIVGTAEWMAPEQACGQKGLTVASDVYALGAILYALLTGRPPFKGEHLVETLRQAIETEPPPPRLYNPRANRDLEVICLKCLQKDPAKRYSSAEALAQDLERWQAGEPILARPVGRLERAVKWVRRNKGLSAGVAAAVLALVVGTAVATWQAVAASIAAKNEAEQRQTADAARKTAEEQKTAAELARKAADKALLQAKKELFRFESMHYIDHIVAADQALQNHDFIAARQHLDECRSDFRHVEYAYLSKQLAQQGPRQLLVHGSEVVSLVLSSDGKRLCWGSPVRFGKIVEIKVWDVEAGKETLTLRGHTGDVNSLALSPDGKRLFSGGWGEIKVWDLEAGKETLTLRGHTGRVYSLAMSPDGKRLFSGSADQTIKVWDLETGKETLTLHGHMRNVTSLALSWDGKRLFSGSVDATIKMWDVEAGKEILTLRGHTDSVTSLVLSPDGKRLCSGGWDSIRGTGEIKVWDVDAGKEALTLRGHTMWVTILALSPDGKRLFSGSGDKTIKVWDVEAGKETLTLRGHTDGVSSLALSSDGKRLFSGSFDLTKFNGTGEIKVWDLETGKETLTLRGPAGPVTSLALSPDGKRLFSGSWDYIRGTSEIKVWDLETGKETLTLRGPAGLIGGLALSSDGKRLLLGSMDKTIKVWDLDAGKETLTLRGHTNGVTRLALSPDGKRLFSGSVDHTIKLWDLEVGRETLTLRGHAEAVTILALSPDGKRLFSGSGDKTIKVWDVEAGKETLTLRGHTAEVLSLALSPDGKRLCSGSADRNIKVWDFDAGK